MNCVKAFLTAVQNRSKPPIPIIKFLKYRKRFLRQLKDEKCCVLGLGYIGLPTAAIIAKANHEVVGVDTNKQIIEVISKGNIHFANLVLKI